MNEPYIGSIVLFAGNFAPRGWALCQGQLLSIAQNTALFSILGTTYGGNGQTTFALPNLQGQVPIQQGRALSGTTYELGEVGGTENVTLLTSQMPAHTHMEVCNSTADTANSADPSGCIFANTTDSRGGTAPNIYTNSPANATMAPTSLSVAGGSQPHNNMQPYLAMNYIIALVGLFPSRN